MCTVLTGIGLHVSVSGYYAWKHRPPSARDLQDAALIDDMRSLRLADPAVGNWGPRRMWAHLRDLGVPVARCTVERLFAAQGWTRRRGSAPPLPVVGREEPAWVVDLAPAFTTAVCAASPPALLVVVDTASRRIVAHRAVRRVDTATVLSLVESALSDRQDVLQGPVVLRMTERLAAIGVEALWASPADDAQQAVCAAVTADALMRPPDRAALLVDRAERPTRGRGMPPRRPGTTPPLRGAGVPAM